MRQEESRVATCNVTFIIRISNTLKVAKTLVGKSKSDAFWGIARTADFERAYCYEKKGKYLI
jgi:hypothetical protein